jgi:hypothetical protein
MDNIHDKKQWWTYFALCLRPKTSSSYCFLATIKYRMGINGKMEGFFIMNSLPVF